MDDYRLDRSLGKTTYKDVLKSVTMMWTLRLTLITCILFVADTTAKANVNQIQDTFCNWIAYAALAVAQNRDNGDEVCPAAWQPGKESLSPSLELVRKI